MNKLFKTVLIVMLLIIMPMRQFGQIVKNNIIEIDLFAISNPDYRYCLLSSIANDDNISYVINEEESSILLSSNTDLDSQQFQAYYDNLKALVEEEFNAFSIADKETQGATFTSWKESLPQDLFVLLFRQMLIENPNNRDGNQTCATADPFCTTDVVSFYIDASVSGSCEPGPDYGCMTPYIARPPYWFYMKIGVAGTFTIQITNSNNNDLDFCAWGPFSDPVAPCPNQLTSNKIIDCDSPYNSVQECTIPSSSQVGQYYLMVITRYSSGSTTVSFSKVANSGPGETDCGILPPLVNNEGPYCVGETINLTANGQAGANYSWTGPGGFTSNQQNPTRPNCTMNMAGTYTCTISVGNQTNSATTEVVVYPQPTANFTFTSVCQGTVTQFTNTSTTNPSGQAISYLWNFGDGQTSTEQNPTHMFSHSGEINVTLTASCGDGHCTDSETQTVSVYAVPAANAGPDQTIGYGGTAQLSGSGGAGTFNYHWEPANMVTNANSQNTQTVALTQDQTYTLTVTNPQGNCTSTDQVTIHISGSAMTVNANASPNSICQGSSSQLQANAGGGTGNFTYSWTPTTGLSNPNIYNPIASPTQTTTYTCHVSDGQTSQNVSVTVTVHYSGTSEETAYICPDESYQWHGGSYNEEGDYNYVTQTQYGCDSTITLHLHHYATYDETTIQAAICSGESYNFYGNNYNYTCNASYTDHTIHGCDSIVRLDLTVWPEHEITLRDVSLCPEQLPYSFYGEDYYGNTDVTVIDTDMHGCDSAVRLVLTVSDYYMPEVQTEYLCYTDNPSFDWNPVGNYHFNFHEEGFYADTLPTAACEGIFRLDLHFLQVPEVIVEEVITCDSYTWPMTGQTFTNSGDYYTSVSLSPYPCDQVYHLHLTINTQSILADETISGRCDSITIPWFGQEMTFYENTPPQGYTFSGETDEGCYREQTFHIQDMHYTPQTEGIHCQDADAVVYGDTIAVITNTEFFSFQYTFYVAETGHDDCVWDRCRWTISKPSWTLQFSPVPEIFNGKPYSQCKVFVADRDPNLVELRATVNNDCDSITNIFYLKSSFLDIEEHHNMENAEAKVNIIPNPNNGQMQLQIENMEGRLNVKVCNLSGVIVDDFEIQANQVPYTYNYAMKRLSNGVYFFVISDGKRSITKKVVIIH